MPKTKKVSDSFPEALGISKKRADELVQIVSHAIPKLFSSPRSEVAKKIISKTKTKNEIFFAGTLFIIGEQGIGKLLNIVTE